MKTLMKVENIHKKYGNVEVLKGIHFEVYQKEVLAITGPSGAGKSTLLHIMGTIEKPDEGKVIYQKLDLFKMKEKQLSAFRNQQLGFVFQFHHLLFEFTALENVCIPALIAGKDKNMVKNKAEEWLNYFGLSDRMHHKPAELSGGEQQRVAVARALINDPILILADEPSGNLDSKNAEELHQLFFKLREQFEKTFVIVTHNPSLSNLCDRCLLMKDGSLQ
ncbi:MAG: ABC-type antimicrobial peptide transport system, ATPase component [Bacteroidetes bacterium 38_7]|nr:MAG: ABC-type antimicrobial peptide transport system, ATPase component [Bacteroidetes bacterium 38_7]